jgi:hypothetical protein
MMAAAWMEKHGAEVLAMIDDRIVAKFAAVAAAKEVAKVYGKM